MIRLSDLVAPPFYGLYYDITEGRYTHYWLGGGRGSTKSTFVSVMIVLGMMQTKDTNAVVIRKVGLYLKDSVYEQIVWAIEKLCVSHLWQMKLSPLEMIYLPTGQKILFRGADKPKKLKSTKVSKGYIRYIWFEEVDEFAGMEEIRVINQSLMRGGEKFEVFYSYNPPPSQRNWVNNEVLEHREDRIAHHSTYESVPRGWLGEQFIAEAEHLRDTKPMKYNHEYLGQVTGTGAEVFTNLTIRSITEDEIKAFDRIYMGVDWGYYPDPFSWVKMHYDAARRTLFIFDELTLHKASNQAAAEKLIKNKGVQSTDLLIADSAEPKSVADFREYGLFCRSAEKGKGSVDYSMKWLQSRDGIVIDNTRCPNTAEEFLMYEYEQRNNGEVEEGYPDANNHHIDAVRYAMSRVWRKRGQ